MGRRAARSSRRSAAPVPAAAPTRGTRDRRTVPAAATRSSRAADEGPRVSRRGPAPDGHGGTSTGDSTRSHPSRSARPSRTAPPHRRRARWPSRGRCGPGTPRVRRRPDAAALRRTAPWGPRRRGSPVARRAPAPRRSRSRAAARGPARPRPPRRRSTGRRGARAATTACGRRCATGARPASAGAARPGTTCPGRGAPDRPRRRSRAGGGRARRRGDACRRRRRRWSTPVTWRRRCSRTSARRPS